MPKQKHSAQIVIIENNAADVHMLRYALDQHQHQYQLHVLSDGDAAIRFVQEQGRPGHVAVPCVIVLDLHLPRHCGIEVMRTLRESRSLNHVAVVVLTGFGSPAEQQEALNLGARLYKTKPLFIDEWIELADEILKVCGEHIPDRSTHLGGVESLEPESAAESKRLLGD